MAGKEATEAELQLAIDRLVAGLPPESPATIRLYRIEPTVTNGDLADWIRQGLAMSGTTEASGRWFSATPDALGFYALDSWPWEPALRYLDLDAVEAGPHRVDVTQERVAGRSPREFSADHETEYFLPRALAEARLDGGLVSAALAEAPAPWRR